MKMLENEYVVNAHRATAAERESGERFFVSSEIIRTQTSHFGGKKPEN